MKLKGEMETETFGMGSIDAAERKRASNRERLMVMGMDEQSLYRSGGNSGRNLDRPGYPCDDYGHED